MNVNLSDLKKLDFENIGQWPNTIRWAIIVFVCAIVFFIGYTIDSVAQFERLDNSIAQEQNLKLQVGVTVKLLMAEKTDQIQVKQMKKIFGQVLKTLPKEFNIPHLLEAISQVGRDNDLKIKLLKPDNEKTFEFYSVIPLEVKISGDYHQLAKFVSDLANLEQPIRFTDMVIAPEKIKKKSKGARNNGSIDFNSHGKLQLQLIAEVYRNNSEGNM